MSEEKFDFDKALHFAVEVLLLSKQRSLSMVELSVAMISVRAGLQAIAAMPEDATQAEIANAAAEASTKAAIRGRKIIEAAEDALSRAEA